MNKLGNHKPSKGTASAPPPYFIEEAVNLNRIDYASDRGEGDTGDGGNVRSPIPKRIRLRKVGVVTASKEQQHLNLKILRRLSLVLAVLLGNIFILVVIGYSVVIGERGYYGNYKLEAFCHFTWIPLVTFSNSTLWTWILARGGFPSKCLVGSIIGFQLLSIGFATIFVAIGAVVLLEARSFGSTAEPVLCSFMIIIGIVATIIKIGAFVKMLKVAGCDAKLGGGADVIFEVVDEESSG